MSTSKPGAPAVSARKEGSGLLGACPPISNPRHLRAAQPPCSTRKDVLVRRQPALSRDGPHPLSTSFITPLGRSRFQSFPRWEEGGRVLGPFPTPLLSQLPPTQPQASTFVQDRPKDGQAVIDGGTVPSAAPELMLALLDAQLHAFCYTGHDFDVIAAEAQLLGDQAWDGAAEQRLGAQRCVLLAQGQGPADRQRGWHCRHRTRGLVWMSCLHRGGRGVGGGMIHGSEKPI